MKYLLIQRAKWTTGYEVNEFETPADLAAHITHNGIKDDAIVAERKGFTLSLGEWTAPVEEPVVVPVAEEKAA